MLDLQIRRYFQFWFESKYRLLLFFVNFIWLYGKNVWPFKRSEPSLGYTDLTLCLLNSQSRPV